MVWLVILPENVRIFIRPGITDMPGQINGLAEIVRGDMHEAVLSGDLFLFCNRKRDRIKILYWERYGFCLWLKRLEQDRIPWPGFVGALDEKRELKSEQLKMLLDGVDFFRAHQALHYSDIA